MLRKALERENIRDTIQEFIDNDDFDYGLSYSWMLEGNTLEHIYIYEEDDKIIDFINVYHLNNVLMLSPSFMDCGKIDQEMSEIDAYWNDFILESEYFEYPKYGYTPCAYESSINPKMRYNFFRGFFTKSEKLIPVFRDEFEKERFPELKSLNDLTFEIIDNFKDLYERIITSGMSNIMHTPSWTNSGNVSCVAGFHYFSVMEVQYDVKYLIAFNQGMPVGLIKLGLNEEYGYKGEYRQVVCYIDVNEFYQKRGVAKLLISKLAGILNDTPLVLTDESEKGKLCHMKDLFKNAGYKVPVYTEKEFFTEYLYPKYNK